MTESNNQRTETLKRIDEEWRQFVDVAKRFSPEELILPNAVAHWTVRDLLIHMAAWDGRAEQAGGALP